MSTTTQLCLRMGSLQTTTEARQALATFPRQTRQCQQSCKRAPDSRQRSKPSQPTAPAPTARPSPINPIHTHERNPKPIAAYWAPSPTGGAAGGYGGQQIGHGFLGGVGGAVAGSMLEDAVKKERRKEHKHKKGEET